MTDFASDISAIQNIDAVPKILEVVCRTTGMGFAAIARVTESRWVCCAVRDEINFGLQPGGELKVETTLCHEIRQSHQAIVIDNVADDAIADTRRRPCMGLRATSRCRYSCRTAQSSGRFAPSIRGRPG